MPAELAQRKADERAGELAHVPHKEWCNTKHSNDGICNCGSQKQNEINRLFLLLQEHREMLIRVRHHDILGSRENLISDIVELLDRGKS